MLTAADFISQYKDYSDEQLLEVHRNRENYSTEANSALESVIATKGGREAILTRLSEEKLLAVHRTRNNYSTEMNAALDSVIATKGGMEVILKKIEENKIVPNEIKRLTREINSLKSKETNADFIKTMVSSPILPKEKVDELIDDIFGKYEVQLKDEAVTPRTIVGSLVGGALGVLIGGAIWGLQLIYTHTMFYALGFVIVVLCYGIIRLITRQSKYNIVVLIATILSTVLAIFLGMLLYRWIGYRG